MLLLVSMHIGIALTMNIVFWWTTALLILLALPWGTLLDRAWATRPTPLAVSTE
jgi:hypothetical protein